MPPRTPSAAARSPRRSLVSGPSAMIQRIDAGDSDGVNDDEQRSLLVEAEETPGTRRSCLRRVGLPIAAVVVCVTLVEALFVASLGGPAAMVERARYGHMWTRWNKFNWVQTSRVTADLGGRWVGTATCVEICDNAGTDDACGEGVGCAAELNITATGGGSYRDAWVTSEWGDSAALRLVPTLDARSGLRADLRRPRAVDLVGLPEVGALSIYSPVGSDTIEGYLNGGVSVGMMYELRLHRVACQGDAQC